MDQEIRFIQNCQSLFPGWSHLQPLPQPRYLGRVLIQNREKSFGRSLHRRISGIWWSQLRLQPLLAEPSRHSSYISIASTDIDRADLFKPASYLLADNQISTKCLFRIRTQHTKEIPTHHLTRRGSSHADQITSQCHNPSSVLFLSIGELALTPDYPLHTHIYIHTHAHTHKGGAWESMQEKMDCR